MGDPRKPWDSAYHAGVRPYIRMVVDMVEPLGPQLSTSGGGEITIKWEDRTVYVRRYANGPNRWRLATRGDVTILYLKDRDPTLYELQTGDEDPNA